MSHSLRRFAKFMKVSLSAVQRARDTHRFDVNAEGQVDDLSLAREQWLSRSEARGNSPVATRPPGGAARPQRKSRKATPPPVAASLVGRRLALVVPASGDPAEIDAARAVLLDRVAEAEREIAIMVGTTELYLLGDEDQQRELLEAATAGLVVAAELAIHGVES